MHEQGKQIRYRINLRIIYQRLIAGSPLEGVPMSLLTKLEEMQKSGKKVVSLDYVIVELDRLARKHRQALRKAPYVDVYNVGVIKFTESKKSVRNDRGDFG